MTKLASGLVVVVRYVQGQTARLPWVTEVEIRLGGTVMATATLGGRFSQRQALAEFRRQPGRFHKANCVPLDVLVRAA
jgi:hypothetical protein